MIKPTVKKARLSAISLSKSLNIPEKEARLLISQVFNAKSWDNFIKDLPFTEPSVAETELYSTHQFMAEKLAELLSVDMSPLILSLVKSISPFSKKPKAYRVDFDALERKEDPLLDLAQMREMMELMGEGPDEMMAALSKELANSDDPDTQRLAQELSNTSFDELQDRMRISHPMNPVVYANILLNFLEWDIPPIEEVSDENIHGEPCFAWLDELEEEHPVFMNSIVVSPGDSNDDMFFNVLDMISDGYVPEFEKPILLFGNPVFKEIGENRFAVIGVWNNGDGWRWLFLSKKKPWEQLTIYKDSLIDELQNSLEDPAPPAELAEFVTEEGFPGSLIYHCIAKPNQAPIFDDDDEGKAGFTIDERMVIGGATGWSSYV